MNKSELNKYAIALAQKAFQEQGYKVEDSPAPKGQVNFLAVASCGRTMKVKVRSASKLPSYFFIEKSNFNIEDPDLFMMVLYISHSEDERTIYLIPATEWGKNIYPFTGKDYTGLKSPAEWGINFSQKAKDAMEPYRFSRLAKQDSASMNIP